MNRIYQACDRAVLVCREVLRRLRAVHYRCRGAHIGAKTAVGARVLIENPRNVFIGERAVIEADVYFKLVSTQARIEIGDFTFIGRGCQMDVSLRVRIGAHSLIAPGCFITDHKHAIAMGLRIDQQGCREAEVTIGNDVWIGANCTILPGITISDGAVVGAGAVVTSHVGALDIVAGVPARKIGSRLESPDGNGSIQLSAQGPVKPLR